MHPHHLLVAGEQRIDRSSNPFTCAAGGANRKEVVIQDFSAWLLIEFALMGNLTILDANAERQPTSKTKLTTIATMKKLFSGT